MKERKEISNEYKWDLSTIYVDKEEVEKDYKWVKEETKKLAEYENTMLDNVSNFYYVITKSLEIEGVLEKLLSYASLLFDEDTSNNQNQALDTKMGELFNEYVKETYFINNSILKLDKSTLEQYYKEEPRLKEYNKLFNDTLRYKEHKLTDIEEKLISSINQALGNNYTTYTLLSDSDMVFDKITDEEGNLQQLSNSNFTKYISSNNKEVRKEAFESLYKSYKQYKNTYASIIYNNIKEAIALTKLRKYNSCIESSLFNDELNISIYDNLINTINNNLSILHKYYKIKKELFNYNTLNVYDVYASVLDMVEKKYSYEEGKEMVRNAISVLGEDYVKIYDKAFEEKWVDVYPNKGKKSGAYSGGSYHTNPFLLLNYQDKYDSVSTLAHEIGHSIHSYLTRNNNPYQYGSYPIIVAEVASTVNELLLAKYVLKNSKDIEEKKYILERMLELFRATIFRQTMFAEFEKDIYNTVEQEEVLTADVLCDKYYELNKRYFGKDVELNEEIKYEWERIPHFYYNFYVYKYAIGLSAACKIVNDILDNKQNAVENYLSFLKSGRTLNPKDTFKLAGIDLESSNFVEAAVKTFEELLDDFYNCFE